VIATGICDGGGGGGGGGNRVEVEIPANSCTPPAVGGCSGNLSTSCNVDCACFGVGGIRKTCPGTDVVPGVGEGEPVASDIEEAMDAGGDDIARCDRTKSTEASEMVRAAAGGDVVL